MSEIDWNTELRKIEREFDGLPPLLTPEDLGMARKGQRRAQARPRQLQTAAGAAVRLGLVVALAVAINFWPYGRACGLGLTVFLGAEAALLLGALWTTVYTWRGRLPKAHVLAMVVVLWALVLIAAQVLPRVGYARTAAEWVCGTS